MDTSARKILDNILLYCLSVHPTRTVKFFKCLDVERTRRGRLPFQSKSIEIEESVISENILLAMDTYATSVLAFIGLFLNILGCCHLLNRSNRRSMYSLMLSAMLIFDILYLVFKLMRSLEIYIPLSDDYLLLYYTIANTGTRFSLSASILMMIAIGRIRYQAVRKPLHQRVLLSSNKKRMQMLFMYLIPVLILSLTFSIPTYLEINDTAKNTEDNDMLLSPSSFRLSPLYSFFVLGILNFVILGILPFSCLIYFGYKIILHTNKKRLQNRQAPHVIKMMNETNENVSKSCVMIIIIFILMHSPRVISSVGEFYVVSKINKNDNFGLPIWLQFVAPISELCTVLNSCMNIIVYRYLTSAKVLRYCPTCLPCCFRDINAEEIHSSLPNANLRRTNTPVEELGPSHSYDDNINRELERLMLMASHNRPNIPTEEHESVHSSDHAIAMDVKNETCSFQAPKHTRISI